jgi:predicted nucleic-acid-binding protein
VVSVDTNVLVRFLTADDPDQFRRTAALIEREDVFIAKTVVLETEWVLRTGYGFSRRDVEVALRGLGGMARITFEDSDVIAQALDWLAAGLEFADALHLASTSEDARFVTFDRDLISRAKALDDAPEIVKP